MATVSFWGKVLKYLLTSDLHFTDNPRDNYRFELFDWLLQQQKQYNVDATFILGDLTDGKDRHSSVLVNRIVDGLKFLKPSIYIPMGNHDYINPDMPFFYFLDHMNIWFHPRPFALDCFKIYLIPHQPDQASLDAAFKQMPAGWTVMCHQTFAGAQSETGMPLTGFKLPPNSASAIYSGDVHAPQIVTTANGDIVYCGSPYHVRFGDNFKPRVLLIEHGKVKNLYFPAPKKVHCTVRDVSELPILNSGDQIKVDMELTREEMVEWENHKSAIHKFYQDAGVGVYGTKLVPPQITLKDRSQATKSTTKSNAHYFSAFCSAEKVPSMIKKVGSNLL